jgi:hypothetical protein
VGSAAITWTANAIAVGVFFEIGVGIGSGIGAAFEVYVH